MRTTTITFPNGGSRDFEVIETPVPHVLIDSAPKLHGWSYYNFQDAGKRECTHERFPLNPYGACENLCWFCYARRLGVYPRFYDRCGIMTVYRNFPAMIAARIAKLHCCCVFYLSTATDPWQAIETRYHYSEETIKMLVGLNLPVEFITKRGSLVPRSVFEAMAEQAHSFAQFTIITPRDDLLVQLAPKADTFDQQLGAIRLARASGIKHVVARFDPIIPTVLDDPVDIESMFDAVKSAGAAHVIASSVDIPGAIKNVFFDRVKKLSRDFPRFKSIYTNDQAVGKDLNATMEYRRWLFGTMKEMASKRGLTFSLCMEFEVIRDGGSIRYRGLNEDFATSKACEGIDTPIYYRESLSDNFKPLPERIPGCDGNCLASAKGKDWSCKGACNCEPFTKATPLEEKHYKQMWDTINTTKLF
jgi:DNA repair photolyase